MRSLRSFLLWLVGTMVALSLGYAGVVTAASANISQSFYGPTDAPYGSIVSLDTKKPDSVLLSNRDNGANLVGVIVPPKDSLLAINGAQGKVQVATTGVAQVLVTTLNGDIKVGDQVGVSPFSGFGMKADGTGSSILGLSQTTFGASSRGASKQSVTDKNGKQSDVYIGLVTINVSVGIDNTSKNGAQLNALQKVVKSFTGKTISTFRIVMAMAVGIVSTVALVTLIYASIFGSIISIGRNPLAKFAILRSLLIVVAMAMLITFVAGATIIFLLS